MQQTQSSTLRYLNLLPVAKCRPQCGLGASFKKKSKSKVDLMHVEKDNDCLGDLANFSLFLQLRFSEICPLRNYIYSVQRLILKTSLQYQAFPVFHPSLTAYTDTDGCDYQPTNQPE